jgi:hypothetical protein
MYKKQPAPSRNDASFEERIASNETVRTAIRRVLDQTNEAFSTGKLWARPDEVARMKVWIAHVMRTSSVDRETKSLVSAPYRIGYCIYLDIVEEGQIDVTTKRLFAALERAFYDYEQTPLYKFMRTALDNELHGLVAKKYARRLNNKRNGSKHSEIAELVALGYPRALATADVFNGALGK